MIKVISVIIISFNTRELTLKCLAYLFKSKNVELETILVDNASTDGTVEAIEAKYKQVKIIRNKANAGFGKANNQGMKEATGDYVLLLNSDCFVREDTISTMMKAMQAMPDMSVAGCKLENPDGSLQASYGYFPTLFRIAMLLSFVDNLPGVNRLFPSIHVRQPGRYAKVTEVDWVMGALILLKREVFEKTHGFDEKYFMYGEEVEWQYRIKKAGFVIRYIPQARAMHIGGASSPNKAPALLGEMDGWKHWFAKYHPGWQERVLPVLISAGCLVRIAVKPKYSEFYRQGLTKAWQ